MWVQGFKKSDDSLPGTWNEVQRSNGERSASFTCPQCGESGVLFDHDIDDDGKVTPSVVCTTEGCAFHEFIKLEGWKS